MSDHRFGKALVVGGGNGIGLAVTMKLSQECDEVVILDKSEPEISIPENVCFFRHNLLDGGFSELAERNGFAPCDIDVLVITAGFGRIAPFETFLEKEIENVFGVNAVALTRTIRYYYPRMMQKKDFYCAVMGSIAGLISSPMISVYSATKAAICKLVEGLNIELEASGSDNRILNVSPGSVKGTRFNGAAHNDLSQIEDLSREMVDRMYRREELYIPDMDTIYGKVLERYHTDPHKFGLDSCMYKIQGGRMNRKPQLKVGYLSGVFDVVDARTLSLIREARQYCDYLVIGLLPEGKVPFGDRCEVLKGLRYVDQVIEAASDSTGVAEMESYYTDKGVQVVDLSK